VIVAFDANWVYPLPVRAATVIVPVALVKETLFKVVLALLTAPRLNPVPLIVAKPLASTLNAARLL
jgi:hypothetical protein